MDAANDAPAADAPAASADAPRPPNAGEHAPGAPPAPADADWQDVLAGDDEDAFRALVAPHTDTLLRAATLDLDYYTEQGFVHDTDLTPEEVVGETLIYAWTHRDARPEAMSLRGWLLAAETRVVRRLVERLRAYRADKALSLDERLPSDVRGEGEQARQQYDQHDTAFTWEDATPGTDPRDVEAPLFANPDTFGLDPDSRHVVMMHDEFDLPLPEVASMMRRSMQDTAKVLAQARTKLRDATHATAPPEAGRDDVPTPPSSG
jgi:RNA polymerase sigma-70 factor (ECF subfamily)